MKNFNLIILYFFFFFGFVFSQNNETKKLENNKKKNKAPTAITGKNIQTFPGATITLSGEKSEDPDEDLLQYIWSFPPSFIFEENYKYDKTDRLAIYTNLKDNSIKSIETYTRSFLVDLPNSLPIGSKHTINLTVKDPGGLTSSDSFTISTIMPDSSQIADKSDDYPEKVTKSIKKENNISISIQSITSQSSASMNSSAINGMIYNILSNLGMDNIIDPSAYIADTLYTIKKGDLTKAALKSKYNDVCETDSCAAQNAIMLKATHVLTWTFSKHSSLVMNFYKPDEYLQKNTQYSWSGFSVPVNPKDANKTKLPNAISISNNDDLFITSGNNNNVYKLGLDQKLEEIIAGKIYNKELSNLSGLDIGADGKIYFSDKDNNRIISMMDGKYQKIADENSSPKIIKPTSIRYLGNGSIAVLCEGDQSIRKISSNGRVSTILAPGIVEGMTDLAVDNDGEFFVVSPHLEQVFKIINSKKVEVIAGFKKGAGLKGNKIPAKEAQLFYPVSIDFDDSGKLYIAEKGRGFIRYMDSENLLIKIAGGGNIASPDGYVNSADLKLTNMSSVRVGKDQSIYVSQMLDNSLICIDIKEKYEFLGNENFMTPMYLIQDDGISALEPYLLS
ncbi:MAG: hypothetical protein P8J35_03790, partial [Candidatus Marinimicrobia bacterium]|nr:hypothetical protein [Candidatus Neomarinimicrobiota bacterium]